MITHTSHACLLNCSHSRACRHLRATAQCAYNSSFIHLIFGRRTKIATCMPAQATSKRACDTCVIMYLNKNIKWNPENHKIPNISCEIGEGKGSFLLKLFFISSHTKIALYWAMTTSKKLCKRPKHHAKCHILCLPFAGTKTLWGHLS